MVPVLDGAHKQSADQLAANWRAYNEENQSRVAREQNNVGYKEEHVPSVPQRDESDLLDEVFADPIPTPPPKPEPLIWIPESIKLSLLAIQQMKIQKLKEEMALVSTSLPAPLRPPKQEDAFNSPPGEGADYLPPGVNTPPTTWLPIEPLGMPPPVKIRSKTPRRRPGVMYEIDRKIAGSGSRERSPVSRRDTQYLDQAYYSSHSQSRLSTYSHEPDTRQSRILHSEHEYRLREQLHRQHVPNFPEGMRMMMAVETAKNQERIDSIRGVGDEHEVRRIDGNRLTIKDLRILISDRDGLNDEIVFAYLTLIAKRNKKHGLISIGVRVTNFFYEAEGKRSRRSARKTIFDCGLTFVPIFDGSQWTLFIFNPAQESIEFYAPQSLEWADTELLVAQLFADSEPDAKRRAPAEWKLIQSSRPACPNYSRDSGVFVCQFAECAARGVPPTFEQEHMSSFRQLMFAELLNEELNARY